MRRPASIFLAGGVAAGLLAGFVLGRSGSPVGPLDGGDGPAVATFRGHALRADAVRAAIATLPASVRTSVEPARKVVEDLARTRVVALAAIEKGYDLDPELARPYAEQLAAAYLEKEIDAPERAKPPTDDEVRAYLEVHRADYALPERVRVALVSFVAAPGGDRGAKRAKALAALKDARAHAGEYYTFGELARARSEDPRSAARNGELGEVTREELSEAAGAEVAAAAFAMKDPGVHDSVIESATGFHVLKLLGREASYEPRLDDLRDTVRARLAAERRTERRKALLDRMWNEAGVRIDEAALKKVLAEVRSGRK